MGDSFAPLGPPLLPWENRMGRGHTTHGHCDYYTKSAQWLLEGALQDTVYI